jgi:catechol 2,3-dioxygenase-like lactoylglutathione lyase family enzyme
MRKGIILLTLFFAFGPGTAFSQNDSAPTNEVGIQYVGNVAVAVSDLGAALHFYCDQLGLTEIFRLYERDGSVHLVYLRVNNDNFLEIHPGFQKQSVDVSKQIGFKHLGFWVKNLQSTLRTLQGRGIPLPDDAFKKAAMVQVEGSFLFDLKDPDGNVIQLSQLNPDSKQVKARR